MDTWTHRGFHEPLTLWKQILFVVMGIFVGESIYCPYTLRGYVTLFPLQKWEEVLLIHPSKHSKQGKYSCLMIWGRGMNESQNKQKSQQGSSSEITVICEWLWVRRSSSHSHRMRKEFGISWSKFNGDDSRDSSLEPDPSCIPVSTRAVIKNPTFKTKNGHFYKNSRTAQLSTVQRSKLHWLCQDGKGASTQESCLASGLPSTGQFQLLSLPIFGRPDGRFCNHAASDRASLETSDPKEVKKFLTQICQLQNKNKTRSKCQ